MNKNVSGKIGVHKGRLMKRVGRLYKTTYHALDEAVANAANAILRLPKDDPRERTIWVEVHSDKLVITDNGLGMLPQMLPDDLEVLERYFTGGLDITAEQMRERVDRASRLSLFWLLRNIGLSSHVPGSESVTALYGIGALAYQTYARLATMRSRPHPTLARRLWPDSPEASNPPTYQVALPTPEELEQEEILFNIVPSEVPLQDPYRKPLQSGTMVIISDLFEGVEIQPTKLANHLGERFALYIKGKALRIIVRDHVTTKRRNLIGSGRDIEVTPPSYKGVKITKLPVLSIEVKGKSIPLLVELYYSRGARGPSFIRQFDLAGPVVELEGGDLPMFDDITGEVHFPEVPDQEMELWGTAKWLPNPNHPITRAVIRQLQRLGPSIDQFKKEYEQSTRSAQLKGFTEDLARALAAAMSSVDYYGANPVAGKEKLRREPVSEDGTDNTPAANKIPGVYVRVLNEHGQPVAGVEVRLLRVGGTAHTIANKEKTKENGGAFLGLPEVGKYQVQLGKLPDGWLLTQEPQPRRNPFTISSQTPGTTLTFRVLTGAEPPPNRVQVPRVFLTKIPDPEIIWQEFIREAGRIEINEQSRVLLTAQLDAAELVSLGAHIVSLAVIQASLTDDMSEPERRAATTAGSELYVKVVPLLRQLGTLRSQEQARREKARRR